MRVNSLSVGSDGGGRHRSIAVMLIQIAKRKGVELMGWLTDVLERIVSGRTKTHELYTLPRGASWVLLVGKVMAAGGPSPAGRVFLAWDAQIEIQQQDMAHLAERRGQSAGVRDLGAYLVARHTETQQQLR
jgi:hypothetical protein